MKRPPAWLALVAAVAAAALVQIGALRAPFFADDWLFLDQVRSRSFLAALASPDPIGNFFRPLGRAAWFWMLAAMGGESPGLFHAANLALWLAAVALLWAIARAVAGPRVAAIAAAIFAVTHTADVPVLWASGAQDLLALVLALGAVLLFQRGRAWPAGLLLLLAPLAKETAAVAIVPAVLLARVPGESWRATILRSRPLLLAIAGWALLAAAILARRHAPASALALSAWGPLAALAGLPRVVLGLEWRTDGAPFIPFTLPRAAEAVAVGLAVAGVVCAPGPPAAGASRTRPKPGRKPAVRAERPGQTARAVTPRPVRGPLPAALAWAVCAALPVALVSPQWSAYYFLFAMAGAAVALGLLFARFATPAAAVGVLVLGLAAQQARGLEEFATAPSPWSAQSHVNRFYLERGMAVVTRSVADLRRAHPTLPHRSTLFLAGVPSFAALQVADGPLVRAVYRDSSLRSYYIAALDAEHLKRGPAFLLFWDRDANQLVDRTNEPDLWLNLAVGDLLNDHPEAATEALAIERKHSPGRAVVAYAGALVAAARGDTAGAHASLAAQGFGLARQAGDAMQQVQARLAARDTSGARRLLLRARQQAVLEPAIHRVLSTFLLADPASGADAVLEAFASVALTPGDAQGWRNWCAFQRRFGHDATAYASIEHYFALDPSAVTWDTEANLWRGQLRDRLPGGRLAQQELKKDLHAR